MARIAIKSISRNPEKFIPTSHREDKELDEANPDVIKRPLVFMVRKMSRDEQFKVREMIEFKDDLNPEKGINGTGDVAKFIWVNNIVEVRNVAIYENGAPAFYESVSGKQKDDLWETHGMDAEMNEAIMFARTSSSMDESEVKN